MVGKPTIYYFPIRGRAEVMKLAFAAKHIEFATADVDYSEMKSNRATYPFGQCPRLVDGDIDMVQSNAILRYIGRKCGFMGHNEAEMTTIDMIMEGVESLRVKYVNLIYNDKLEDAAKETYWEAHFDKATAEGKNGGAHIQYLVNFLVKNGGKYCVGSSVSMADLCLWDITDLHMRILPDQMKAAYPELVSFYGAIAALPGVKEYLAGPQRMEKPNGNTLG